MDRGVYESLDLRLACHPSESPRYLVTRLLAYALSYEDGIAFSKGGLSSTDEPPVLIRDAQGILRAWIDVGNPAAERLHRASKSATRVAVFTTAELEAQKQAARSGAVHRAGAIELWQLESSFVDALAERVERNLELELTRTDGRLYLTLRGELLEGSIERGTLVE